ncbi:response regulator [Roseomonas sp. KE2513]|uniref:response regulator n=1 Tax=Roseomonas sp. KE2513 TaxID=2479202 RepID=UPI0018DFED5C|nr:response regulator [Roseomonas sp. KE2513]MBI0537875.1 response regulator [Roseomonas sp. KE2513]
MPDEPAREGPPRVLVAEDEEAVALLIDLDLSESGYCVTCAPDGAVAAAELESQPFDAVVTDVRMPNLDGVGLVRKIVATWPGMPIVVLSGYMTEEQNRTLLSLGVQPEALLEKPDGFRHLRSTLEVLLASRAGAQGVRRSLPPAC